MATTETPLRDNKELALRFITNVWNGEAIDAIETLAPPDLVVHQLGGDVDRMVAEDDTVLVYQTVTGTPERQYEAMWPTGNSFDVPAFQMFRIEGGQIAGVLTHSNTCPRTPVGHLRAALRRRRGVDSQ